MSRRRGGGRPRPGSRPVVCEANPAHPEILAECRLFALLGTWMEQDVVEATVRNAFAQGVEAVYLVDNASTDATVARAVGAGATLAESFRTAVYEERIRNVLSNAVVARVSLSSGAPHIWWLWLDGDEFPEGPEGTTVAEYLGTLDRRFRMVGSTYYEHFPVEAPAYLPGFHPLDFQPMGRPLVPDGLDDCPQAHGKHPLQRFDRSGPFLSSLMGFRSANLLMGESVLEPEGGIVTHRFAYRQEQPTRRRIDRLQAEWARHPYNDVSPDDATGAGRVTRRRETLDAVYGGRWDRVDDLGSPVRHLGVHLSPWTGPRSTRWYGPRDLERAKEEWAHGGGDDPSEWRAVSGSPG
jgi:hypothetical protein